jgi:hypothetical protein
MLTSRNTCIHCFYFVLPANMLLLQLREVLLSHSCGNSRTLLALLRHVSALQNTNYTSTRKYTSSLTALPGVEHSDLSQQQQRQYNSWFSSTSNCQQALACATQPHVLCCSVSSTTAELQAEAAGVKHAALQSIIAGARLHRCFAASADTHAASGKTYSSCTAWCR